MISVWRELRCASPAAETAGMLLSAGASSPLFLEDLLLGI